MDTDSAHVKRLQALADTLRRCHETDLVLHASPLKTSRPNATTALGANAGVWDFVDSELSEQARRCPECDGHEGSEMVLVTAAPDWPGPMVACVRCRYRRMPVFTVNDDGEAVSPDDDLRHATLAELA